MLFTNTQQSFKFSSFIKRRKGGEKKTTQRTKQKGKKKDIKKKQQKQNKARLTTQLYRSKDDRELTYSHTFVVCTSITEVATHGKGGGHMCVCALPHPAPTFTRTSTHAPTRTARTHIHTHRHACRAAGEGRRVSPVRVLLYVIIRGGTIKQAGVEGLPLLPSGEDAGDGAESHLLFLLFPFLVFKIL